MPPADRRAASPCSSGRAASSWPSGPRTTPARPPTPSTRSPRGRRRGEQGTDRVSQVLIQGLVFGILAGGIYALMSSGMVMIFGVMRMVNLGHAAIMLTGSYIAVTLLSQLHVDPLVSIPIVV